MRNKSSKTTDETEIKMNEQTTHGKRAKQLSFPTTRSRWALDSSAPVFLCVLISLLGLAIAAAILALSIPEQNNTQSNRFRKAADEAYLRFDASLDNYRVSGLWVQQACRDEHMTFAEFRGLYRYIVSTGVEFLGVSCGRNVTNDERRSYEARSRKYLAEHYPDDNYEGFVGFTFDPSTGVPAFGPIANKSTYFVTAFVEPLDGLYGPYNLQSVGFDITTSPSHADVAKAAFETGKLSVTGRLNYLPPPDDPSQPYDYTLIMCHPGIALDDDKADKHVPGKDAAVLVVRFAALLEKAYQAFSIEEQTMIYVYDTTDSVNAEDGQPAFLGGAKIGPEYLTLLAEVNYTDLPSQPKHRLDTTLTFAARQWSFVVIAPPSSYQAYYFLATLGALMIVVASLCAALWIYTRSKARTEKAAILLESAHRAAQGERELNDFVCHEVRNPLSAAISATKFVSLAVNEKIPLETAESLQSVREDVIVVANSLQYINDLLRSMLDFHCAVSNQIQILAKPVDIRNDIFRPVASMLYHRGCEYDVFVDCPDDIIVMSDPLRLKQVILNLAVNASKFVIKGFVRLRAEVKQEVVSLYVEDSGPGIPSGNTDQLFNKYQPSLDSLNQGTGIGLSLCKHLVELMQGNIRLDEDYNSGIEGCPGCRFVVVLNSAPLQYDSSRFLDEYSKNEKSDPVSVHAVSEATASQESFSDVVELSEVEDPLPEQLSVLFVDDDLILRKLFVRSVKRCRPAWSICEAASGEAALQLISDRGPSDPFDLIFMDQYMASAQKQLLGTETVQLIRSKGIASLVCGLSANNIAWQFKEAGADYFIMKPLPCEASELVQELNRVLHSRKKEGDLAV